MTRTLLPIAGLALLLSACASRPPEPTADTTAPRPSAATNAPAPASPSDAGNANPSGSNLAAGNAAARAPNDHSVYFAFDSDALSAQAQQVIEDNARYDKGRNARVRLEGNADERGSREYNLALGQRRAEAVRKAMQLDGVGSGELEAVSNGEERPRCTEHTEDCWAQNRRVDIVTR